jgi:hypothetical protein
MPVPPFSIEETELYLQAGNYLSSEELAIILERNPGVLLPAILCRYVIDRLRHPLPTPLDAEVQARARDEFKLGPVKASYGTELKQHQAEVKAERKKARAAGDRLPKADKAAYERAAKAVMAEYATELGPISFKRFFNMLSDFDDTVSLEGHIPPDEHDPPDHIPRPKGGTRPRKR